MPSSTLIYGPSGIGKTTVGKILAAEETRKHIDTDRIFEEKYGDIGIYIQKKGLIEFRKREGEILEKYIDTDSVITLGGGTLLLPANQELSDNNRRTITLMIDVGTLVQRIQGDKHNSRPLVTSVAEVHRLYGERYNHYTHQKIVLHLDKEDAPEEVARNIQKLQARTNLLLPIY